MVAVYESATLLQYIHRLWVKLAQFLAFFTVCTCLSGNYHLPRDKNFCMCMLRNGMPRRHVQHDAPAARRVASSRSNPSAGATT
jgi:hypothetical protein